MHYGPPPTSRLLRLQETVGGVFFVSFNCQWLLHHCTPHAENNAVWSQSYWQALQEQRALQLTWMRTYRGCHSVIFLVRNLTLHKRSSAAAYCHCVKRPPLVIDESFLFSFHRSWKVEISISRAKKMILYQLPGLITFWRRDISKKLSSFTRQGLCPYFGSQTWLNC